MSETMIDGTLQTPEPISGDIIIKHKLTGTVFATVVASGYATEETELMGGISSEGHLYGCMEPTGMLDGDLAMAYSTDAEAYEGDYEVTPTVEGLELPTKHKYMADDVTIRAIPFFEVSNNSGGNTVYIADEI